MSVSGYYRALMSQRDGFEPETIRFIDGVYPSAAVAYQTKLNTFLVDLKTGHSLTLGVDNISTIADAIYIHAFPSALGGSVPYLDNLVTADIADRITVTTGSAVISADVGVGLNAKGSRASHKSLSSFASVSSADDMALFSYLAEAEGLGVGVDAGFYGNFDATSSAYIAITNNAGQLQALTRLNTNTGGGITANISAEVGAYSSERVGTTVTLYKDNVSIGSYVRASTALSAGNFAVWNIIGLNDYGLLGKGGMNGIFKASVLNRAVVKTAFETYKNSL